MLLLNQEVEGYSLYVDLTNKNDLFQFILNHMSQPSWYGKDIFKEEFLREINLDIVSSYIVFVFDNGLKKKIAPLDFSPQSRMIHLIVEILYFYPESTIRINKRGGQAVQPTFIHVLNKTGQEMDVDTFIAYFYK